MALARALAASVDARLPGSLATMPLADGEALYAAADVLDIAVLAALGSR